MRQQQLGRPQLRDLRFFVSAAQMWDPGYGDTQIFGVGGAFVSGVVLLAVGGVLAAACRFTPSTRGYFLQRQPSTARTQPESLRP